MIQRFFIPGQLPSLNEVLAAAVKRRGKWNAYNDLKASYGEYIQTIIRKAKLTPIQRANISFCWVEQSQRRDKDNVRMAAKFILDALVVTKILPNDGWKQIGTLSDTFEVDGSKPGVYVELVEINL